MKKTIYLLFALFLTAAVNAQSWQRVRGNTAADKDFNTIKGSGTYTRTFKIPTGKYFLFSVEITSPHEIFFTFTPMANGIKKIAYTTPGKKQKVMGLLSSKTGAPIRAEMIITAGKKTGNTIFENFQFKEIKADISPELKPYSLSTPLNSSSVIVIPSDPKTKAQYTALARKISAKLGNLKIVDDKSVCVKNIPMLQPGYANCHLIIIGNMNNNRAFWPAYTRKLAVSDAFFPGGKGYEVRTAVNVLSNGKNHIIIGGTTLEGIARGVEKFLAKCTSKNIPQLSEVEVDGECAKRIAEDIADWKNNFPRGKFPGTSPGYDAVRRWYHHALMYYWTGNKFYAEWAKKFIVPIIKQKAYTHHYIMEWLFMTWEVVRNCGIYTAAEKKAMEDLLFANYVELQVGMDMYWMRTLTPPYRRLWINSRHVTSPLWCQLMSSDYLFRNFKLSGEWADLVKFTRAESMGAVDHIARFRSRPDSDFEGGDNYVELANSVYRYAFRFNKFDIFTSKQAIKFANLQLFSNTERDSVFFGRYAEHKMPAAVLGSYYRDGVFKYYEEKALGSKWGRTMFIDRYPCGISAYNNDLKAVLPRRDFTLQLMPYSTFDLNRSIYVKKILTKFPEMKKKTPLAGAVMRNGWNDNFNVMAISGSNEIFRAGVGEITHLSFYRRNFLNSSWTAVYNFNSSLPFEQNTLQVTRVNQSDNAVDERPRTGFLDWKFNLGGRQAVSLLFKDYNGTLWRRTVYSLSIDQYIVHDTIIAEKADLYDISIVWRPFGMILPNSADTLYTRNGPYRFAINMSGKGFKLKTNTASYLKKESEKLFSLFAFHGKLNQGQKITATALLQVKKNTKVHDCGNGKLLFSEKGKVVGLIMFTDDGFIEITPNQIIASNLKDLKIDGTVVDIAPQATDVAWFFPTANCYRSKAGYRKVPAAENKKVMELCRKYLAAMKVPADAQTSAVGEKVEKKNSFKKVWSKNIFPFPEVWNSHWVLKNVTDIGRVAEVEYMRGLTPQQPMPAWLEYSADGKKYHRFELKNPQWHSGIWTHNYGNIQLRDKWFTDIQLPKLKGRYFRFASPFRPQFHLSDRKMPLRPVKILATEPFILASNEVVKIYPRGYHWDNTVYGAFDAQGKTLFVKKQQLAPQDLKVVDFPAKNSIAAAEPDGKLRFYDKNGKELLMIDSIKAMADFHKKWGRSNTRHPAGGFPSTYSIGVWQKDSAIVVGRYGQTGFHTADGKMTGIRAAGIYNINHMLDKGVDFDGDGKDEMLAVSNSYLIHYFGDARESAPAPGTTWPQVYDRIQMPLPVWWNIAYGVWGPKFYTLKALPFGENKSFAAGISRLYLFIYNAAARKYACYLKFPNPASAGDIRCVDNARYLGAVAFDDGVLTVYEWRDPAGKPVVNCKVSFDDEIRAVAISETGRIFAAGGKGIYEVADGKIIKQIDGAFTDVKWMKNKLVTAHVSGAVSVWKE